MKPLWIRLWAVFFFGLTLSATSAPEARVVDGGVIMDQHMRENLCALTFDDGPSLNTPQLLDMLNEYGIPATFFLLGKQAERYPALVQRIVAEGHEVGNHSYSHPNLRLLSPANKAHEIARTDAILRSLGASPSFVRPPYGSYDTSTVTAAEELGLSIMLWSLDSRDWKSLPANYAVLRSTRGTVYGPGALRGIFLFHDTHKRTVEDLPRIISDLRAGGCQRFVTVSDYLDGLLDPEPGVLMTRRSQPAGQPDGLGPDGLAPAAAARKPEQPVQPKEDFQEMPPESYPAGTATLPLARTSRPWQPQAEEGAAAGELQSSTQGDSQAGNVGGSQVRQPVGQPPLLRVAPVAPGPNSGLPVGGPVSSPAAETAPAGA